MRNLDRAVTAPLREVRSQLRQALAKIAERVGALRELPLDMRTETMEHIATELKARLGPHLEWEERTIHPVVDHFACEGPAAFSGSMRYEHVIIYRGIQELRALANDANAAVAFSRRADNLLGVVLAHFELEEEVLFPVLDRALGGVAADSIAMPPVGDPSPS